MHSRTPLLKKDLREIKNLPDKVSRLRNFYSAETAFIFTCGPSLEWADPVWVNSRLSGRLVFCVKQAYELFGSAADFHCFNAFNHQKYNYQKNKNCILARTRFEDNPPVWGPRPDLDFRLTPVDAAARTKSSWLAVWGDFENYLLEKTVDRPWGPGIMYETVIYLAVHLGVRRCVVAGWDLVSPGAVQYRHFYDPQPQRRSFWDRAWSRAAPWCRHYLGLRYNATGAVDVHEFEVLAQSSRGFYEWLKAKGVELAVISDQSYLHESIPKISWQKALA
ncbi:MAG: hypothetical protein A2Z83_00940 [Omnitrophica bacterium GWA2_52_8]|nr:MAG: hypothetical protein A2Z83_00940 [Omnitrophica bacterium GWA2_52_8]